MTRVETFMLTIAVAALLFISGASGEGDEHADCVVSSGTPQVVDSGRPEVARRDGGPAVVGTPASEAPCPRAADA